MGRAKLALMFGLGLGTTIWDGLIRFEVQAHIYELGSSPTQLVLLGQQMA